MINKPIIEEVISQTIGIIAKANPFTGLPVVSAIINLIATKSIKIALEQTFMSGYIKQIEDDLNKHAEKAKEARELLKQAKSPEEIERAENELKEALRHLLSFKP